jgi:hypothetical protein
LFSTEAPNQTPPNLPRFFHAHKNTGNLVRKTFELKNAKVTFEGDRKSIVLRSDKGVFMDGVLVMSYEF